ncbi:uncharacterized protein L969DRAFT_95087 [Mixia osmundae IAM 14324]|uniref:Ketoreductase domain-containing protein n=1 Tax=Mixia osmundae (strain CBS 9802 / IAM 14324 / JCM 22182 / KY 12970) TaxID=764103 RepID=G7E7F6_MIXOS|nr:uncharacterized protein L969DRAFT_95087 [Mixia osmundae IAM 14324]KEI38926.1 hypothetical protein L969DRAFT_95087 [Mixia osmundae IAM 14324]GAA98766.1 hypothetical protein E5Q_05454 [Mixia osmundae IAM 14324]
MSPRYSPVDTALDVIDATILSVPASALIFAYYLRNFVRDYSLPLSLSALSDFFKEHYRIKQFLLLVLLRRGNGALSRLVDNNGVWKRQIPYYLEAAPDTGGRSEIIVVVGGAQGIGARLVEELKWKRGVKIAVMDIAPANIADHDRHVRYYKTNIADPEAVSQSAQAIRDDFGHPSILINCAGILRGKSIIDITPKELQLTFAVNTLGLIYVTKEFLPAIVKANHGHIVNISSAAALVSAPGCGDYSPSKAAVMAFHEVLAAELAGRYNAPAVRTTLIQPIKVNTALGSAVNDHPDKFLTPLLEPDDIAQGIIQAIEGGLSQTIIIPRAVKWSLPLLRVAPSWYRWLITRSGGTNEFATLDSVAKGAKGGYKILVDDAHSLHPAAFWLRCHNVEPQPADLLYLRVSRLRLQMEPWQGGLFTFREIDAPTPPSEIKFKVFPEMSSVDQNDVMVPLTVSIHIKPWETEADPIDWDEPYRSCCLIIVAFDITLGLVSTRLLVHQTRMYRHCRSAALNPLEPVAFPLCPARYEAPRQLVEDCDEVMHAISFETWPTRWFF